MQGKKQTVEKETDGMERLFSVDLRIESPFPFPFRCKAKSFRKFEAEKSTMECISMKMLERINEAGHNVLGWHLL